ncbi:MAG TPA: hypothetical protein VJB98_02475 [Candidatus Paceibacterota bacterium]
MQERFKSAFIPIIIILVASFSFGLGRLSKIEENKPDLVIEQPLNFAPEVLGATLAGQAARESGGVQNYVASRNGTKYYLLSCSGVSRIKEENKIYFSSKEQAEARGLTPAANCPGL